VITPLEVAVDATHIYWASTGTFNFINGSLASDGKIERVTKDGATRDTFASDLSAPLGLAIDENDVYFGEAGVADDDASVGLYRVQKSGGAVATLFDDVAVGPLRLDGNTLVFFGTTDSVASGVFATEKSGASLRTLYASDLIETGLRVADRRAYFLQESDGPGSELAWVSIDAPGGAIRARAEIDGDDFLLDGCAAISTRSTRDRTNCAVMRARYRRPLRRLPAGLRSGGILELATVTSRSNLFVVSSGRPFTVFREMQITFAAGFK
jgi:hypothetical protein